MTTSWAAVRNLGAALCTVSTPVARALYESAFGGAVGWVDNELLRTGDGTVGYVIVPIEVPALESGNVRWQFAEAAADLHGAGSSPSTRPTLQIFYDGEQIASGGDAISGGSWATRHSFSTGPGEPVNVEPGKILYAKLTDSNGGSAHKYFCVSATLRLVQVWDS